MVWNRSNFMPRTKILKIFILLLPCSTAIGDALEQSRLYRSAYFLGRGDTGIANADNHEAIFYNPAGLAQGKGIYKQTIFASPTVTISEDTKDLIRKVSVENNDSPQSLREHVGKNQHIGLNNFSGIVFRRAALGAMVSTKLFCSDLVSRTLPCR